MIKNLTTAERKILASKRIVMSVSPYEATVIYELRKHTHAEITVTVFDSIPFRCKLNMPVMMEDSEDFDEIVAQLGRESLKNQKK